MTTPDLIETLRDAASEACSTAESVGHPLAGGSARRANINACGALAEAINAVEAELERLRADGENLRTLCVAAAEEIHQHWEAHCDAEGYGPTNLMHRLEKGIPAQYSYKAGDFARLKEENERLRAQVAPTLDLMEAVDNVLTLAHCECPHSMRFDRGEHMSGCYLFDLNLAYIAAPSPAAPAQQAEPYTDPALKAFLDAHPEEVAAARAELEAEIEAHAAQSMTVGEGVVPEVAESLLLGQAQQLIGALMNHGLLPKTADEASYLKLWDVVKRQLRCVNREGARAALAQAPAAEPNDARDAARYRWLRDTDDPSVYMESTRRDMDARVDAAMSNALAAAKEQQP